MSSLHKEEGVDSGAVRVEETGRLPINVVMKKRPEKKPCISGSILNDEAEMPADMQRAATDIFHNLALLQDDARHASLRRSNSATSVRENVKSANAQVTEWGFPGTRGTAKTGSQSSLAASGKPDVMSLSSGSSVSHESRGSLLEQEESRHQQHLEFLVSLVLHKHKLFGMTHCKIDSLVDTKMILLILLGRAEKHVRESAGEIDRSTHFFNGPLC